MKPYRKFSHARLARLARLETVQKVLTRAQVGLDTQVGHSGGTRHSGRPTGQIGWVGQPPRQMPDRIRYGQTTGQTGHTRTVSGSGIESQVSGIGSRAAGRGQSRAGRLVDIAGLVDLCL